MLLRFRGPDGTVRIDVEPSFTFRQLAEKVDAPYFRERVPVTDALA